MGRIAALQLPEPAVQCLGGRFVAAPDVFDTLADLPQGQRTEKKILRRDLLEPRGHAGIAALTLPKLGNDVGVDQIAHSSSSRPWSWTRSKSASSPTGGMASRSS